MAKRTDLTPEQAACVDELLQRPLQLQTTRGQIHEVRLSALMQHCPGVKLTFKGSVCEHILARSTVPTALADIDITLIAPTIAEDPELLVRQWFAHLLPCVPFDEIICQPPAHGQHTFKFRTRIADVKGIKWPVGDCLPAIDFLVVQQGDSERFVSFDKLSSARTIVVSAPGQYECVEPVAKSLLDAFAKHGVQVFVPFMVSGLGRMMLTKRKQPAFFSITPGLAQYFMAQERASAKPNERTLAALRQALLLAATARAGYNVLHEPVIQDWLRAKQQQRDMRAAGPGYDFPLLRAPRGTSEDQMITGFVSGVFNRLGADFEHVTQTVHRIIDQRLWADSFTATRNTLIDSVFPLLPRHTLTTLIGDVLLIEDAAARAVGLGLLVGLNARRRTVSSPPADPPLFSSDKQLHELVLSLHREGAAAAKFVNALSAKERVQVQLAHKPRNPWVLAEALSLNWTAAELQQTSVVTWAARKAGAASLLPVELPSTPLHAGLTEC